MFGANNLKIVSEILNWVRDLIKAIFFKLNQFSLNKI